MLIEMRLWICHQSVLFEELLEVVTRAVAQLNIEWPVGKECQERPKSKLDEHFLFLKSPPQCRGFAFFSQSAH